MRPRMASCRGVGGHFLSAMHAVYPLLPAPSSFLWAGLAAASGQLPLAGEGRGCFTQGQNESFANSWLGCWGH